MLKLPADLGIETDVVQDSNGVGNQKTEKKTRKKRKTSTTNQDKKRVSMTFNDKLLAYLEALSGLEDKSPTTYAYELVCEKIRQSIESGTLTADIPKVKSDLQLLILFIQSLVNETEFDDEALNQVADIVGTKVETLIDVFYWEPENEQDL